MAKSPAAPRGYRRYPVESESAGIRMKGGCAPIPAGTSWTFALGVEPEIAMEGGR